MLRFPARVAKVLTRETSGGRFIPEVDGLRFFAIGAVLLYHINGYILAKTHGAFKTLVLPMGEVSLSPTVAQNPDAGTLGLDLLSRICAEGYVGVQFFFVISGLILGIPFAERWLCGGKPVSLRKYFFRRVLRLEPPYLINLGLLTVAAVLVWHMAPGEAARHLGASAAYSHFFLYGEGSSINAVAWSLEIEVQFYVLAPLLSLMFAIPNKVVRRAAISAAILGIAWIQRFFHAYDYSPTHGWTILNQLHWFLAGFLLADVYLLDWRDRASRAPLAWDIASAAALAGIWVVLMERLAIHFILPFAILAFYAGAFRGRTLRWFVRCKPVYIIGGMCYTIYLYHFVLISGLGKATANLHVSNWFGVQLLFQILVLGAPVLAISAVLFALFEKPFMLRDWPSRARQWLAQRRRVAST